MGTLRNVHHIRSFFIHSELGESVNAAEHRNGSRGAASLDPFESSDAVLRFALALDVVENQGALDCSFYYDYDLFEPQTIQTLAEHFLVLLEGALQQPQTVISKLPL